MANGPWTPEERKMLVDLKPTMSLTQIAEKLGRTKGSVAGKWDQVSGKRKKRYGSNIKRSVQNWSDANLTEKWSDRKKRCAPK